MEKLMKKVHENYTKVLIILIGWIIISSALLIGLIYYNSLIKSRCVGESMEPSIHTDDYALLTNFYFAIKKGDMVSAVPRSEDMPVIKRVVATEGDHVYMHDGHLYINDVEDTTDPNAIYDAEIDLIVPQDSYYLMGDNRNRSADSRIYGPVYKDKIRYKVVKIYKNSDSENDSEE